MYFAKVKLNFLRKGGKKEPRKKERKAKESELKLAHLFGYETIIMDLLSKESRRTRFLIYLKWRFFSFT